MIRAGAARYQKLSGRNRRRCLRLPPRDYPSPGRRWWKRSRSTRGARQSLMRAAT